MEKLGISTAFALLICFSLSGTHAADICSQESITTCQETHFLEVLFKQGDGMGFPVLTDAQFDEICNAGDAYAECISAFEDECADQEKLKLKAIQDAFDFGCVTYGKQKFLAALSCFDDSEVQEEGSECQDARTDVMAKITEQLQASPPPNEEQTKALQNQFCKKIEEHVSDCVYRILSSSDKCDADTALALYTYGSILWGDSIAAQGCDALDEDPTTICTDGSITTCQETNFLKVLFKHGDGMGFPVLTEAEFDEICNAEDAYKECISAFEDNCDSQEKLRLKAIKDAFDFGCVTYGKQKFLAALPCFEDSKVQEEGSECQDARLDEMAKITEQLQASTDEEKTKDLQSQFCKKIEAHVSDCVYTVLSSSDKCDADTALALYTYGGILWGDSIAAQGCDPLDEDPSSATGTLGYTLLVNLATILLAWSCVA